MATGYTPGIPNIKVESSDRPGQAPHIKQDPENAGASPSARSDDDIYEDAGDLDFTGADQKVFLSRLPKFLWEHWSKLDDDAEITIGRVRVEDAPNDVKRISLRLDDGLQVNRALPKEYNLHIANRNSHNTFIFSEKDMPGHRKFQADNAPMHWLNRKRVEKKKQHGSFRRAIPKQTGLRGRVTTEVSCQPVENDEYGRFTENKSGLSFRPKASIQIIEDTPGTNVLAPGMLGVSKDFRSFINKAGPARRKGQQFKAARIPRNDLLDILFDLFREYTYWPFSALKQRVQQPEAYLKEVLEDIAILSKSGPHMSQWHLKDDSKLERYGTLLNMKEEVAPDPGPGASFDVASDVDMNDETVEMEDVNLG